MLTEACTGQYGPDPWQWSMNSSGFTGPGASRSDNRSSVSPESGNPDSADRTKAPQGPIPINSEPGSRQGNKDDCRGKARGDAFRKRKVKPSLGFRGFLVSKGNSRNGTRPYQDS